MIWLLLLTGILLLCGASEPHLQKLTPEVNQTRIDLLTSYHRTATSILRKKPNLPACGIFWVLSSLNGSSTNYEELKRIGDGEGMLRILAVVHEVFTSAARVKHALKIDSSLPTFCKSSADSRKQRPELTLFTDRDVLENVKELSSQDLFCVFDRVIYFDELPSIDTIVPAMPYQKLHMLVRLAPRPNIMKLVAFLSSPYQYSLYLDGDTSPCAGFQKTMFGVLKDFDVLTTPNPLGYESTFGAKRYPGAPQHSTFDDFVEINGGVFAFKTGGSTLRLIARALELVPHFASLGYDQDQAMMRHALYESIVVHNLKAFRGRMEQYCRFGWSCDKNSCEQSCVIIHQRICNRYGVPVRSHTDNSTCGQRMEEIARKAFILHAKNSRVNKVNRKKRTEILHSKP